jgi:hypothetical protein
MRSWLGNEQELRKSLHSRHRHPIAPRLPVSPKEETTAFWHTPEGRARLAHAPKAALVDLPTTLDAPLPPSLLQPEVPGILREEDKDIVLRCWGRIAERWATVESIAMTAVGLNDVLDLKTREPPSYYTEYMLALRIYRALVPTHGDDGALDALLTCSEPSGTAGWHVQTYFVSELIFLQVSVAGAFSSFGYVNYPGWTGGSYNDPDHLPYRVASDT